MMAEHFHGQVFLKGKEDKEIFPATVKDFPEASEPEKDFLSVIVDEFNREFSGSEWRDISRQIRRIAEMISEDGRCWNAVRDSDEHGL